MFFLSYSVSAVLSVSESALLSSAAAVSPEASSDVSSSVTGSVTSSGAIVSTGSVAAEFGSGVRESVPAAVRADQRQNQRDAGADEKTH